MPSANTDPADQIGQYESLSTAFLLILERLSPEERAAFLLHEVFDYSYAEIAGMLHKSEAACRQLFSRAKKHVVANRPRFRSSPEEHRRLLTQFIAATQSGELGQLTAILANGVTAIADGGGKMAAFLKPIHGPEPVARMLLGIMSHNIPADTTFEIAAINEREAILLRDAAGHVTDVVEFQVSDGRIQAIYFLRNPDKLQYLKAVQTADNRPQSEDRFDSKHKEDL